MEKTSIYIGKWKEYSVYEKGGEYLLENGDIKRPATKEELIDILDHFYRGSVCAE